MLAVDLVVFALQLLTEPSEPGRIRKPGGVGKFPQFSGWRLLYAVVAFRWLRSQLLWRLRNRLIVTYVFIGVIPVFLLVMISRHHALSSGRAVCQLCGDVGDHEPAAQHGVFEPGDCETNRESL